MIVSVVIRTYSYIYSTRNATTGHLADDDLDTDLDTVDTGIDALVTITDRPGGSPCLTRLHLANSHCSSGGDGGSGGGGGFLRLLLVFLMSRHRC